MTEPSAGLTQWVRATAPDLDLHLWSDVQAGVHRARIVSGTVGLIDILWAPHRFQISAHRPFTRTATGWLDAAWYPTHAAAARVRRAVSFGEMVRAQVAPRARFGITALADAAMLTQDYTPLLAGPLDDARVAEAVRDALLPPPIPGGAPFFSVSPDAVLADAQGELVLARVYGERAPELRFAAAQAVVDLGLYAELKHDERAEQIRHLERIADVRRELGLRTAAAPLRHAGPARALVLVEHGASPRLREQFEAVQSRLVERGLLEAATLTLRSV